MKHICSCKSFCLDLSVLYTDAVTALITVHIQMVIKMFYFWKEDTYMFICCNIQIPTPNRLTVSLCKLRLGENCPLPVNDFYCFNIWINSFKGDCKSFFFSYCPVIFFSSTSLFQPLQYHKTSPLDILYYFHSVYEDILRLVR